MQVSDRKIAVIVPGNTWLFPYLETFKTVLDEESAEYEILIWDREGKKETGVIAYEKPLALDCAMPKKIAGYASYARFLEKTLLQKNFSKLIFLTPLVALFMRPFLGKYYRGRFWLDYRDMSWELKVKPYFDGLVRMSADISVSSPAYAGLIRKDSVLCHNIDSASLFKVLESDRVSSPKREGKIVVSNIGYIRHLKQQKELIDALANDRDIEIRFCGDGQSCYDLRKYVAEKEIANVVFSGRYDKSDEPVLFSQADFVNIYLPKTKALMSAMSNRFYQSLLCGNYMIVNTESVQAEYVRKYDLGVCINSCKDLAVKLKNFNRFDSQNSVLRNNVLSLVRDDQRRFINRLRKWIVS